MRGGGRREGGGKLLKGLERERSEGVRRGSVRRESSVV